MEAVDLCVDTALTPASTSEFGGLSVTLAPGSVEFTGSDSDNLGLNLHEGGSRELTPGSRPLASMSTTAHTYPQTPLTHTHKITTVAIIIRQTI